ncbi:MAG: PAS domain-containing protein [Rhizobiales bacterium]|nr:PAS domain-containing protein [Hyphomicrobiales bacterium]
MRGERPAPGRSDLDLRRLGDLLPYLAIIEKNSRSGTFRWRLAGTGICQLYRQELTGGNVLAGFDGFETNVIGRLLDSVICDLQPCLLRFRFTTDLGHAIGAEMIGLPLTSSDGQSVHVFGGLFPFQDNIAGLPFREIASLELSAARGIWTEHLPEPGRARPSRPGLSRADRALRVIPGGKA